MCHFESKYCRIKALVKANYKQLKIVLVLEVRRFDSTFLASILGQFLLFNNFLDLCIFLNFLALLASFIPSSSIPNLMALLLPLFFQKTNLLPLFLFLKADSSDDLINFKY